MQSMFQKGRISRFEVFDRDDEKKLSFMGKQQTPDIFVRGLSSYLLD